jgi:predicted HTH domain antitoxin
MDNRQIVIDVPEKVLLAAKTDEVSFARELRILAAIKLYELGRLSSGRAAELAGMPRVEFLLELGRYQVFPFEAELEDMEQDPVNKISTSGNRSSSSSWR